MTLARPYFQHSHARGYIVESGAPARDTVSSPAPLALQTKGFEGLSDLARGKELRPNDAAKFGRSARFGSSTGTDAVGGEGVSTRSLPVLPIPTVSVTKAVVGCLAGGIPAALLIPPWRVVRYGQTTVRTAPDVLSSPPNDRGVATKTTFLEIPAKRGLKRITGIKEDEFDLNSTELHRIIGKIAPMPAPEGPAPRDEASIALVRQGWRIKKLSPEQAATFGVGSAPMQHDQAYAVWRTTSYRKTSGFLSTIPVLGTRTTFTGVTTQVLLFAPSEEHPQGRAIVKEVCFRQYAPRLGYKVKLKEGPAALKEKGALAPS